MTEGRRIIVPVGEENFEKIRTNGFYYVDKTGIISELAGRKALEQIDAKQYAAQFLKGYRSILCYGAAFYEKSCLIRRSKETKRRLKC